VVCCYYFEGGESVARLVVVGNGMAGVACVEQILKHRHDFEITILGDETHVNYNRILLSGVLAGEKSGDDIVLNDIDWYQANNIRACLGRRATQIDRERWVVRDEDGGEMEYDRLILATGFARKIASWSEDGGDRRRSAGP
jgi:nitrite reductase (NADH) large subunit